MKPFLLALLISSPVMISPVIITPVMAAPARQTEADGYTRYELLDPASHKFRILYDVTATTPGATAYYNPIRPGSAATDERVSDRATGQPLAFREVDGPTAQAGGVLNARADGRYIEVTLARPVPAVGGARVFIDKTYEDAPSYFKKDGILHFERPLGIARNAVVLPQGYELVACNVPSQILQQPDGRIMISFWNNSGAQAPLRLQARKASISLSAQLGQFPERALQTRNIVYYLQSPEIGRFSLTHDYTETRPGTATYINIVRPGSTVSDPSAQDLDTGAAISHEILRGAALKAAAPDLKDITETTEAVVFRFTPVEQGQSRRIRITETYTDRERYALKDGELNWHRSFGRAANAVILPAGYALTNSSIPATVSQTTDNRIRLDFINARPDEIDVQITASRSPL
jgi:hypothetical protein